MSLLEDRVREWETILQKATPEEKAAFLDVLARSVNVNPDTPQNQGGQTIPAAGTVVHAESEGLLPQYPGMVWVERPGHFINPGAFQNGAQALTQFGARTVVRGGAAVVGVGVGAVKGVVRGVGIEFEPQIRRVQEAIARQVEQQNLNQSREYILLPAHMVTTR